MSVIAAVNLPDRLVLLEDGRELPITGLYTACRYHSELGPLTAKDQLMSCCRTEDPDEAEVFTVDIPGAEAALIVEVRAISTAKPSQIN